MEAAAVQAAIGGAPLDVNALDTLVFDPERAVGLRSELVPLLVQLARANPEAASQVPESAVIAMLRGLSFGEVLQLTQLDVQALGNPLVRPMLLAQLAEKADISQDEEMLRKALHLLADPELDTASVASLEKLLGKKPQCAAFVPFAALFTTGAAELRARLMAVNTRVLPDTAARVLVPTQYIVWDKLDENDVLLQALQIDYAGDIVAFVAPNVLEPILRDMCREYDAGSLFSGAVERTLAKVSRAALPLFTELDSEYQLVCADRTGLIAQVDAKYTVENHPKIVKQLTPRALSMFAVANIAQTPVGLRMLPLTTSNIAQLPESLQLLLASCATQTEEGARWFEEHFPAALKVARTVPETEETRDWKASLRANVNRFRLREEPSVGVQSAIN